MFKSRTPVETMACAVYTALATTLPDIEYEYQTPQQYRAKESGVMKKRRPCIDEVEVIQFHQIWGSTALGFGGIGGSAMTGAYTTIIIMFEYAAVFFDGRFAYMIREPNDLFWQDVQSKNMNPISKSNEYNG